MSEFSFNLGVRKTFNHDLKSTHNKKTDRLDYIKKYILDKIYHKQSQKTTEKLGVKYLHIYHRQRANIPNI